MGTSQQHKGDNVCMNEWSTVSWVSIDNRADDGHGNQHIKAALTHLLLSERI